MDDQAMRARIEGLIRNVPDFPQPGIQFKDITPVLQDPQGLRAAIDAVAEPLKGKEIDAIVGLESRGFLFGAPIAYNMSLGFVIIRKPGKLPADTIDVKYELEYGSNVLEMHRDSITPGQRVVIVDDLLATGGTARGAATLVEQLGGVVVGFSFLIELEFLQGREKLAGYDIHSIIRY